MICLSGPSYSCVFVSACLINITLISNILSNHYFLFYFIRSEQDKEPELEVVSDAVAAGPSEESAADGM